MPPFIAGLFLTVHFFNPSQPRSYSVSAFVPRARQSVAFRDIGKFVLAFA